MGVAGHAQRPVMKATLEKTGSRGDAGKRGTGPSLAQLSSNAQGTWRDHHQCIVGPETRSAGLQLSVLGTLRAPPQLQPLSLPAVHAPTMRKYLQPSPNRYIQPWEQAGSTKHLSVYCIRST